MYRNNLIGYWTPDLPELNFDYSYIRNEVLFGFPIIKLDDLTELWGLEAHIDSIRTVDGYE
jgi:hypothetical protein